jgi:hypothetical protein
MKYGTLMERDSPVATNYHTLRKRKTLKKTAAKFTKGANERDDFLCAFCNFCGNAFSEKNLHSICALRS